MAARVAWPQTVHAPAGYKRVFCDDFLGVILANRKYLVYNIPETTLDGLRNDRVVHGLSRGGVERDVHY
jgi:hypothetical protein